MGGKRKLGVTRLLLKHSADVHARDKRDMAPLQVMLERGDFSISELNVIGGTVLTKCRNNQLFSLLVFSSHVTVE
jgi:hypothetical protein